MNQELTIQEAIFTLANINKQIERINRRFHSNFFGPTAIDGKPIVNDDKQASNEQEIKLYQELIIDASTLREAIAQANNVVLVEGSSLTYQLEWVRQTRSLVMHLERLIERQEVRVENGVGVVEYNAYNEAFVRDSIDTLTKKVNKLSSQIDQTNAHTTITVNLLTDV